MNIIKVILSSIFSFAFILIIARILGKKQMGQLTFFDYITGIAFGSMIADTTNINKSTPIDNFIAIATWGILSLFVSFIARKIPQLRAILDGEPSIIIKKGKIQYKELKKIHINIDDLTMLLRSKDVFSVKEVEYAILEPDGKISVLKREPDKNITKKDMNISTKELEFIPTEIITDGHFMKKNLKELGISEKWVNNELKKQGIRDYKDVLYAEVQSDRTLYVDKKM